MAEEEPCVNEKKGLLQDCLPGVTLHNSHAYYHQHRPASPHPPQEIDQLQQQIIFSNLMNKISSDDFNEQASILSSVSSKRDQNTTSLEELSAVQVLWIDKNSNNDSGSDGDDLDDIASYSFSIRQAAAVSEAKRRSEERWVLYFKYFLVALFFYLLWDELQPTNTENTSQKNARSADPQKRSFRFNKHWNKKVDSMYRGERSGRDEDEKKKILVALKDLDENIHGDIVLRSNKSKYLDAAMVWQRQDCAFDEQASMLSSSEHKLPPLAVVEAQDVNDVQRALPILGGLARDYKLEFRVRSGGFAYMSGYGTVSDGVMLSLAKLDAIAISNHKTYESNNEISSIVNTTKQLIGNNETRETSLLGSRTVVMGPGVRTEDFMKEVLDVNGYSGIVASAAGVGMGGFVLGGGYGLQSRMYGLAIDNVLGLEVVLPSGELKEVKQGDDLFWALCGAGGGNIGVVTSIQYQIYPSHDMKLAGKFVGLNCGGTLGVDIQSCPYKT